ncbi:MAG: arylsulfatase [Verrucomicrobiota bacterium]|nr:arylsulfatase [Verrucomicrobiota bacterium]
MLLLLAAADGTTTADDRQPNVVLVLTDDQGFGDVRSHGNPLIDTPVQDRIAAEGVRFERFFVSPVCAPTRASLLTGRYHIRTGVHGVTRGHETMRADEVTLAELLKGAGYATGAFGKWHNGSQYPHHPNGQGFNEFLGFCAGHWNNYFDTTLDHNGTMVKSKGFIIDTITDAAIEFIESNKDKPFFCYLPYNTPHTPWQVPERYWKKYRDKGIDDLSLACAYAMCENIDSNMGRLLSKLEALKIADDTIFIFLTDNGPNTNRYNAGMKGRKGSAHEGGVRVPCFIRYPRQIKPRTVIKPITAHIDLLPTLMEYCGIKEYKTKPLDGRSLVPLIDGDTATWPSRMLFTVWGGTRLDEGRRAVRTDRWRAVNERRGWELYDMLNDPFQRNNLAQAKPNVLRKLSAAYEGWYRKAASAGFPPIAVQVGHSERDKVVLEAHYAYLTPTGKERLDPRRHGISYHGRSGWANDWIDNWTGTQAYPRWHLNVVREGDYHVILKYACDPSDTGARFRVEAARGSVEFKVTKPFVPETILSPDRVGRKEVPERTWSSLTVGTLPLPKGNTQLRVRALEIPGDEALELKAVHLIRKP